MSDETRQYEEVELSPFTTAKRVRDRVLIKNRHGNLVQKIFISEENWEQIGELFGHDTSGATKTEAMNE